MTSLQQDKTEQDAQLDTVNLNVPIPEVFLLCLKQKKQRASQKRSNKTSKRKTNGLVLM